jgi:hypothetical protein
MPLWKTHFKLWLSIDKIISPELADWSGAAISK